MPNQFAYSKTFFDRWYRPEYTTVIVAGDVDPAKVLPLVEKYWGAWKRGSYTVAIPAGAGADGADDGRTSPGRRRRCPGSSSPSTAPPSPTTAKDWAALDVLLDLDLRPDLGRSTRSSSRHEQKVDQLFAVPARPAPTRSCSRSCARVKKLEDAALRPRRDPADLRRAPRRAGPGPRASPTPSRTPATASLRSLDNTDDDRRHARALRPPPPLVRHAERALPRLRHAHPGGPARRRGRSTSSTPAWS